jgi:hypothetical protein
LLQVQIDLRLSCFSVDLREKSEPPKEANMWEELVSRYAICAREFSDEVALLGSDAYQGPEVPRGRLAAIQAKHTLCLAAADQINRYLSRGGLAAESK